MDGTRKSLLVRADFVLGEHRGADRLTFKRWRRILADVLPRLMGCADRSPRAERVRLRSGEGEGRFSAWVRIPVGKRPSRRRLRKIKTKLRGRLETSLLPVDGRLVKLGVRRCRERLAPLPLAETSPDVAVVATVQAEAFSNGASPKAIDVQTIVLPFPVEHVEQPPAILAFPAPIA